MNEAIEQLAKRFSGLDVQCRRVGGDWPLPWRARVIVSKNERSDYRALVFGSTLDEALQRLIDVTKAIDDEQARTKEQAS